MRRLAAAGHGAGPLLVCLDLQRAQLRAEPVSWEAPRRALACERLLGHARRAGWCIVHAHRTSGDAWAEAAHAPIPGFEPLPTEPVFLRPDASALANPGLAEVVLAARGSEILLAGFDLRTSGLATALDAFNQGATMTLVKDAFWTSPVASVESGVLEGVLWDVVAPFARGWRVRGVAVLSRSAEARRLVSIANDF